jgi:hypothetical protein
LGEVNAVLETIERGGGNAEEGGRDLKAAGFLKSESVAAFQKCLRIRVDVLGSSHPKTLSVLKELRDLDDE